MRKYTPTRMLLETNSISTEEGKQEAEERVGSRVSFGALLGRSRLCFNYLLMFS